MSVCKRDRFATHRIVVIIPTPLRPTDQGLDKLRTGQTYQSPLFHLPSRRSRKSRRPDNPYVSSMIVILAMSTIPTYTLLSSFHSRPAILTFPNLITGPTSMPVTQAGTRPPILCMQRAQRAIGKMFRDEPFKLTAFFFFLSGKRCESAFVWCIREMRLVNTVPAIMAQHRRRCC